MNSERLPNRRDLLKVGAGLGAGGVAGVVGANLIEKKKLLVDESLDSSTVPLQSMVAGEPQDIAYEAISQMVYFETNARIPDILAVTKEFIHFDLKSGELHYSDNIGNTVDFPGDRKISRVYVTASSSEISFAYVAEGGRKSGVKIGRDIADGKFVLLPWENTLQSPRG